MVRIDIVPGRSYAPAWKPNYPSRGEALLNRIREADIMFRSEILPAMKVVREDMYQLLTTASQYWAAQLGIMPNGSTEPREELSEKRRLAGHRFIQGALRSSILRTEHVSLHALSDLEELASDDVSKGPS